MPEIPPPPAAFRDAQFALGAARLDGMPADALPEVAFVGRSNVGKSSLLNALVGRKNLARTSGTPGKTQEVNFYRAAGFYLVDLPGFGYAKVSQAERDRWAKLIGRYVAEREVLRLVCHLVDSRHAPTALDRTVFEAMRGIPRPYAVVLTKGDKLSGNGRAAALKTTRAALVAHGLSGAEVFVTSAEDGRGIEALRARVAEAAGVPGG